MADQARTPADARRHLVVAQAPVAPLDVDGIQAVTVGTTAFALATAILALCHGWLEQTGREWWLGVTISGVVLGLIGFGYCWGRRRRRGFVDRAAGREA